jgi:hypothetical protein
MRRVPSKIEMKLMFMLLSRERKMSKRIAENVQACCMKTNGIGREWQKSKSFFMENKLKTLEENTDCTTTQRDFGNFCRGHIAVFDVQ